MNFLNSISTLQLGLIVLGALLLVALILWNNWNTRRKSPKQAELDDSMPMTLMTVQGDPHHDLELERERMDPVFDAGEAQAEAERRGPQTASNAAPLSASRFGGNGPANQATAGYVGAADEWPETEQVSTVAAPLYPSAPHSAAAPLSAGPPLTAAGPLSATAPLSAGAPDHAPRSTNTAAAALGSMPPASGERRAVALDPLIDVIAPIALDAPVSGDAVLQAVPPSRRVGTKLFSIEALHLESDEWQTPRSGRRYGALQTGVQLASRTGALNEIEFSEFVVKTQAFADALSGSPDFPEMLHEVGRARELDQFASDHDAQLGFKVLARGAAWSPGYVQQHASRLGFVAGNIPGRMVLPAPDAGLPPILTLSFDTQAALAEDPTQAAIREVGLTLDVPQVARAAKPYSRMREVAATLAQGMDGVVTDERGQPLGNAAMDQIESEVEKLYDQLDGHELSAGSSLARRLFS